MLALSISGLLTLQAQPCGGGGGSTYEITLPMGDTPATLNDQDLSWIDQNAGSAGVQIDAEVELNNNDKKIEVFGASGSYSGQRPYLGFYSKGGPDGAYLQFQINKVSVVGNGIHIAIEVTYNSLANYGGTRADKIAFKNDYPVGKKWKIGLEFYQPDGSFATVSYGSNNLPSWRDMYVVPDRITIRPWLNDQDLSWLDQDPNAADTQLDVDYFMSNDRKLEVYTYNTNGQDGYMGYWSKGGPDGSYLKFMIDEAYPVGFGLHFKLIVTYNSLAGYTGTRTDKKAFRDNYPVGMEFVISLEFYQPDGSHLNPEPPYHKNNLPNWRQMYVVSTWKPYLITLPVGIKDFDYSWVDQDPLTAGIQIQTLTQLEGPSWAPTSPRILKVYAPPSSTTAPNNELIGQWSKGGPDGSYLEFATPIVRRVGKGIHVDLQVTFNSLAPYTGTRADKIAFRDTYVVGYWFTLSLEFYDEAGNPHGPYTGNNNLPGLRDMYVVAECAPPPPTNAGRVEMEAPVEEVTLLPCAPNPFYSNTTLRFTLPEAGKVYLGIFDMNGQLVRVLLNEEFPAGTHEANWDGSNLQGTILPSGTYFCRLIAGEKVRTQKLSLTR
jgi:hypothetical protein